MLRRITDGIVFAALLTACGSKPKQGVTVDAPLSPRRQVHKQMRAEYYAALGILEAIVDGRLADARGKATWVVTHGDNFDPPASRDDDLLRAADTIAHAKTVLDSAGGLARLGHACAQCHLAQRANVDVGFANFSPPPESTELSNQMQRHAWASERLWQGMLAPSDAAWTQGADLLASTAIDLSTTNHGKPNAEAVVLAERLRTTAESAVHANQTDRSIVFGEMVVTCARCHDLARMHPTFGDH
ncbi:MAG TPA: hypothetical protein VGM90_01415 [Kofleriaceae bacterium]|jgi:mono/diheme cytochrome c family protein